MRLGADVGHLGDVMGRLGKLGQPPVGDAVEAAKNGNLQPLTEVFNSCIGCGKCVKGCALMNGSLYLQVMQDRCVNCNECAIAVACPSRAFCRVSAERPRM